MKNKDETQEESSKVTIGNLIILFTGIIATISIVKLVLFIIIANRRSN